MLFIFIFYFCYECRVGTTQCQLGKAGENGVEVLGPVSLSVWLRDFDGETRWCRLNQHDISTDMAKLFTYLSTILYSGC